MERATINTNIRLNLNRPDDRQAWDYLQKLDRKKYKSYSRAIVAAINDYFSRQEQLACDPYLETREKEDAFLQRVLDTPGSRALSGSVSSSRTVPLRSGKTARCSGTLWRKQKKRKTADWPASLSWLCPWNWASRTRSICCQSLFRNNL